MVSAIPAFAETKSSKDDVITVGVSADRCPVFYVDYETGEITGIGIDLMKTVANNAGLEVVFKYIEETSLKQALDNKEYDVIMPFGSAIDSARGKKTVVSDNLIQTPFTLVTEGKRDLPPFSQLNVGMLSSQGGVAETVLKRFPGMKIVLYDTMNQCVKALRKGTVDALLNNSYYWSWNR